MKTPAEGVQVPIATASKAQLRAFANHLGCPSSNFDTEERLRKRIADTGYDSAHIIVFENAPAKAASARAIASGDAVEEPMVNLTVHTGDGAGGKRPVFVGVNGKAILIPRAKPCDVKIRYLEALANAIETKWEYDEEARANLPRDLPSYPYQVHKMPSDEAIAKWRAFELAEEAKQRERDKQDKKAA